MSHSENTKLVIWTEELVYSKDISETAGMFPINFGNDALHLFTNSFVWTNKLSSNSFTLRKLGIVPALWAIVSLILYRLVEHIKVTEAKQNGRRSK